jgi:hypothetical protein
MAKEHATQKQLGDLFRRSQSWISKRQAQTTDPMPPDLAGAMEWGKRNGLLVEEGIAPSTPAPAGLDVADLELKQARRAKIQFELDRDAGRYVAIEDVETRALQTAAEFRLVACQYPARARSIIERHVPEASTVDAIMQDLQPLAADLLNGADPKGLVTVKSKDEVREILLKRVEEIIACL